MVKVGIVLIAAAVLAGYAAVTTTQHVLSCVPLPMQSVAHPTQVAMESAVNAVRPRKSPVSDLHVFWDMAVDTANTFRAVLAWSAAYGDMVLAAAVGRDSLCLVDGLGMGGGAHVTENAAERWNSALQRLRPGLLLSNPALVQRAAIAALGFSTGITLDSVVGGLERVVQWPFMEAGPREYLDSVSVHWVSPAWNVTGIVHSSGRRIFFVRVRRDGRIETIFMQDPPDPH